MQPRLIIAGVPIGVLNRHKGYRPDVPGWDTSIVPSRRGADLGTCWPDVIKVADQCDHDGAHILAFHNPEEERKEFEARVYSRHRLIWFDRDDAKFYGLAAFDEKVREIVEFEQQWRGAIRPGEASAALVLPESVFVSRSTVEALWKRAAKLRIGKDEIAKVTQLRDSFRSEHWKEGNWRDCKERIFDHRGARHGSTPEAKRWKFTLALPDGFHFDVKTARGGPFLLTDCLGEAKEFSRYANVDCHGFVR